MSSRSTAPSRLRAITLDGNPWFVAADVYRALGLKVDPTVPAIYETPLTGFSQSTPPPPPVGSPPIPPDGPQGQTPPPAPSRTG